MIEIRQCEDASEWDAYVLERNGHPLQLWGWGEVKRSNGWQVERFVAYTDTVFIGAVQVLIKPLPFPFRSFAYVPRGPICADEYIAEFLDIVSREIKNKYHSVALSIEPHLNKLILPFPWKKTNNHILAAETILLDLAKKSEVLLSDMVKKTRQYIRRSGSDGVFIRQVQTDSELEVCLSIYSETAKRAGFSLHSKQYYKDVYEKLGQHSPVFVAYANDKPVAFLWLAISADIAYELYGGMNEVGQKFRANYALKWHVIQKMQEWGIQEYDFGGLVAGGVSNFKQGWAEPTTLVGTYEYPLSYLYIIWTKFLPMGKRIIQKIRSLK